LRVPASRALTVRRTKLHCEGEGSSSSNNNNKFVTSQEGQAPQGYLNTDLNKMEDGKQARVLAYIGLALVPCLFLVPFFLSRDFVPPVELAQ